MSGELLQWLAGGGSEPGTGRFPRSKSSSTAVALSKTFNTTLTVYRLYSPYNLSAKSVKFSITYSFDKVKKERASLWASVLPKNNYISTEMNWKGVLTSGVYTYAAWKPPAIKALAMNINTVKEVLQYRECSYSQYAHKCDYHRLECPRNMTVIEVLADLPTQP